MWACRCCPWFWNWPWGAEKRMLWKSHLGCTRGRYIIKWPLGSSGHVVRCPLYISPPSSCWRPPHPNFLIRNGDIWFCRPVLALMKRKEEKLLKQISRNLQKLWYYVRAILPASPRKNPTRVLFQRKGFGWRFCMFFSFTYLFLKNVLRHSLWTLNMPDCWSRETGRNGAGWGSEELQCVCVCACVCVRVCVSKWRYIGLKRG